MRAEGRAGTRLRSEGCRGARRGRAGAGAPDHAGAVPGGRHGGDGPVLVAVVYVALTTGPVAGMLTGSVAG